MIKRILSRKVIVATSALFALFLVYMIPKEEIKQLENVPENIEYVESQVEEQTVFLLNQDNLLGRTQVVASETADPLSKVKEALLTLIQEGPNESRVPNGFKAIIPSDTKINSIDLQDGILKVDFSKELLDVNEEMEEKVVEAIVYTATSIKDVKSVIIFVDGDVLTKLPKSGINLPSTLDRSFGINKEYDLTSTDSINQVTVYYVDEYNDNYYYVPVTKYLNDDRDKIKIIIDELTSANMYQTNLMSFLNSNTELLDIQQSEDVLSLNFNSYIFNDATKKDILEEVIYTICLSVGDNYNVEEVVFQVDTEEVYKTVLKDVEESEK
ncbi:MAG TPA: GerMN domain-containing protein [Candidatus Fimihabitans intestinipullorum]|uniref:GerMN domain-containing protein n=1 Tax=Candidatus Fimihabitans intestinipullorum TaxID=2840820 RepID=A0A9D1L330_9BACT|nr:GerMN domain-containing protein [Candidatus Fimihabitans intestinipullorum]